MKKALISFLVLILIIMAALYGVYFIFETKLKDQIIPQVKKIIKEQTDLDVDFTEFHFSFSQLLKLQPTIRIKGLQIEEGIRVEKIYAELYIKELLKKKFEVKELTIDQMTLKLYEDAKRIVHIKGIDIEKLVEKTAGKQPKLKKKKTQEKNELITEMVLKKVSINNSRLEFLPYGMKNNFVLTKIYAHAKDLTYNNNGITANAEFDARLFDAKSSKLKAKGKLGPFPEDLSILPVSAKQTLFIKLEDIPDKFLQETFSGILRPSSSSEIEQDAWISGNLFGTINGEGKIKLKDFILGATEKHTLTANSELPAKFSLNLYVNPNLKIESKQGTLNLKDNDSNKGTVTADNYINVDLSTGLTQGSSRGTINGLELEEALSTFVNAEDIISGKFKLEDYQIYFKGRNADEIAKSLKGTGKIYISDGSLFILKSITKYKDIAKSLITNGDQFTEKLAGQFLNLTSDVEINKRNLYNRNISIEATEKIDISGEGVLKKGEYLVYDVNLKLPRLAPIPINVRGTLEKPSIYPDIKNMGAKQGQQVINETINYGLNILNQVLNKNGPAGTENGENTNNGTKMQTKTPPPIQLPDKLPTKKPSKQELENAARSLLYGVLDTLKEELPAPNNTSNGQI